MEKLRYIDLKDQHPALVDCFFAFSKKQYAEGVLKHNLEGKVIYSANGGLYGTKEGIQSMFDYYEQLHEKISANCDPQEVYDHEYYNHECGYVHDDREAIELVLSYFDESRLKDLKRRNARKEISEIARKMRD